MWSEQSTEQDSTSAPSLESVIIGSENKLLSTKNAVTLGGSDALTKLLTGPSEPAANTVIRGTIDVLLDSVHAQKPRRIEPKPAKSENEGEKLVEAACKANTSGR